MLRMTLNQFSALEELIHTTAMHDGASAPIGLAARDDGTIVASKHRRGENPEVLAYITRPGLISRPA